jgi:hypothetical protein
MNIKVLDDGVDNNDGTVSYNVEYDDSFGKYVNDNMNEGETFGEAFNRIIIEGLTNYIESEKNDKDDEKGITEETKEGKVT